MLNVQVYNLLDAKVSDIDYYFASRLPGEPLGGVDDIHVHPAVPRTFRVSMILGILTRNTAVPMGQSPSSSGGGELVASDWDVTRGYGRVAVFLVASAAGASATLGARATDTPLEQRPPRIGDRALARVDSDECPGEGSQGRAARSWCLPISSHRRVRLQRQETGWAIPEVRLHHRARREVKVKFGGNNGEVYGEVLATRLLWALGFGADRMYPVNVICRGCPAELLGIERPNGESRFDPAVIERKLAAPSGRPRVRGLVMAGVGSRGR